MQRPQKPYPNFPLFAGRNGQWRKDVRVNGGKPRPFYFGSWDDDPKGERAVKEWLAREAGIRAGVDHLRIDADAPAALTVVELLRRTLERKQRQYERHELAGETFRGYIFEYNAFGAWIGTEAQVEALRPETFAGYRTHLEDVRKLGPDRISNTIKYLKAGFRLAWNEAWIKALPVYGRGFEKPATDPATKAMVAARKGEKVEEKAMWTGEQIGWMLANSRHTNLKACILLAANCGIGISDLARLRWEHLKGRRLAMRRGKTGVAREAYTWKKTRDALASVRELPQAKAAIGKDGEQALVFLARTGKPLVFHHVVKDKNDPTKIKDICVSAAIEQTFRDLVEKGKRAGAIPDGRYTFYGLRHTYYSHAENLADLNALHRTVGHSLAGQGDVYRHGKFPLKRLRRIALHVKRRLWPKPKAPREDAPPVMRLVS